MRQPVRIEGPWVGLGPSLPATKLGKGMFQIGNNFMFEQGRAFLAPGFVTGGLLPAPDRGSLGEVLHVQYIESKSGYDVLLFLTTTGIFVGAMDRIFNITPTDSSWVAETADDLSVVLMVTDVLEWVVISNTVTRSLWRWQIGTEEAEEFSPVLEGEEYLPITCGYVIDTFDARLILGRIMTEVEDMPHAIAHYGVFGPFDTSYPTSATMPLTDIQGPVTAIAHIQDFLLVSKPWGFYLGQKTYEANFPFVFTPKVTTVGVAHKRAIVPIAAGTAVAYLGSDRQFYAYDTSSNVDVCEPVRSYLQARDPMTANVIADPRANTVRIVYPDITLLWQYKDNGWAILDTVHGGFSYLTRRVTALPEMIDDAPSLPIDTDTGYIDDSPGSVIENTGAFFVQLGYVVEDYEVQREGWIRLGEVRFIKPTTITRAVWKLRVPLEAQIELRYSLDSGESWSATVASIKGDTAGVTRAFHDFVATSEQFIFEIRCFSTALEIESLLLEIVTTKSQDEVPELSGANGDFVLMGG